MLETIDVGGVMVGTDLLLRRSVELSKIYGWNLDEYLDELEDLKNYPADKRFENQKIESSDNSTHLLALTVHGLNRQCSIALSMVQQVVVAFGYEGVDWRRWSIVVLLILSRPQRDQGDDSIKSGKGFRRFEKQDGVSWSREFGWRISIDLKSERRSGHDPGDSGAL